MALEYIREFGDFVRFCEDLKGWYYSLNGITYFLNKDGIKKV